MRRLICKYSLNMFVNIDAKQQTPCFCWQKHKRESRLLPSFVTKWNKCIRHIAALWEQTDSHHAAFEPLDYGKKTRSQ